MTIEEFEKGIRDLLLEHIGKMHLAPFEHWFEVEVKGKYHDKLVTVTFLHRRIVSRLDAERIVERAPEYDVLFEYILKSIEKRLKEKK